MGSVLPRLDQGGAQYPLEIRELAVRERAAVDGMHVTPYLMEHYSGAPSYALRVEVEGKVLAYPGDTEWVGELIPAGHGADLFICEAYFFDKNIKYHIDYRTPEQAPRRNLPQAHHRHPHERRVARPPARGHARSRPRRLGGRLLWRSSWRIR